MGVHYTVYILNITIMINQGKGKVEVMVKVKVVEWEVVKVKINVKISHLFLIFYLQNDQPAIFKANFSYALIWNIKFLSDQKT